VNARRALRKTRPLRTGNEESDAKKEKTLREERHRERVGLVELLG